MDVIVERFCFWWRQVAATMNAVDASTQKIMELHPLTSYRKISKQEDIFSILQLLLQAFHEGDLPEDYYALSHWWRIQESLRNPLPPQDALHQIGCYLLTLPPIEIKFVHDLVLLSYKNAGNK